MIKFFTWILFGAAWLLSLLPLRVLYLFSDIIWLVNYIFPPLRYRRRIVRKNLRNSFHEKSKDDLRVIERRFYRNFFDMMMEMLKLSSISSRQISRRVTVVNEELFRKPILDGKSVVVYMGHTGNWEWMTSLPLKFLDMGEQRPQFCQIYHQLENPVADKLMYKLRGRFESESIPMERTFRRFMQYRKEGRTFVVAMIGDQVPMWQNIHYWTDFLNQYTPVFTGAERIIHKMDLVPLYASILRTRRGHYDFVLHPMFDSIDGLDDFAITEKYMRLLEQDIRKDPASWLWTHNRWKRTWEGYQNWLASRFGGQ